MNRQLEKHAAKWRFCIAPMMKYTDSNFRYFARLLSENARLYTEMVVASAITRGDRKRFLRHTQEEHPLALQLGGSDPNELSEAAVIGEQHGFDEINLNVGCPSDRVQSGEFGACLMAKPQVVAACVAAIKARVKIPVTVKTRIGIDEHDSFEFLHTFVRHVAEAGIDALIIHARKALLDGLSPLQNRTIPPLRYEVAYAVAAEFAALPVVINGGIQRLSDCQSHLQHCSGVMLGRSACADPYMLAAVDHVIFAQAATYPTREAILREYLAFVATHWQAERSKQMMIKPLYGLYRGQPGAKQWRRNLNQAIHDSQAPTLDSLLPAPELAPATPSEHLRSELAR